MKPRFEQLEKRDTPATLFLDFNGNVEADWGQWHNIQTPAFQGDAAKVTALVAQDFARFNIDVVAGEGQRIEGQTMTVVVGGVWQDWYGYYAGGTASHGAFLNTNPSVAFVFSNSLGNMTTLVACAIAHETGHLLGLNHQAASGYIMSVYASSSQKWAEGEITTIGDQLGFDSDYVAPAPLIMLTVQPKLAGYRKWEWRVEANRLPAGTYEVKATWTTALPKTVHVVAGKVLVIRLAAKVAGPILLRKI